MLIERKLKIVRARTEELSFKEALESNEYQEAAEEMRDRLIYVFKDIVSSGIIKLEEVIT